MAMPSRVLATVGACTLVAAMVALGRVAPQAPDKMRETPDHWGTNNSRPLPHASELYSADCEECLDRRCVKGLHCGRFFVDPEGWQRPFCACGCCRCVGNLVRAACAHSVLTHSISRRNQCKLLRHCEAVPPRSNSLSRRALVETIAGTGQAGGTDSPSPLMATFAHPAAAVGVLTDSFVIISDKLGNTIRALQPPTAGRPGVTTIAGSGAASSVDGVGTAASFNQPSGVHVHLMPGGGAMALVADARGNAIRRVDLATAEVKTIAGSGEWELRDGLGTAAAFASPNDVTVSSAGTFALVADTENDCIRKIDLGTYEVTTVAGNYYEDVIEGPVDGPAATARFMHPSGITLSPDAHYAYIADTGNHVIRRLDLAAGIVSTIAGSGLRGHEDTSEQAPAASFHSPQGVAVSILGHVLAVADTANNLIRHVDLRACSQWCPVTTIAGSLEGGDSDGVGPVAAFRGPTGLSVLTPSGKGLELELAIADSGNNRIRRIQISRPGFTQGA